MAWLGIARVMVSRSFVTRITSPAAITHHARAGRQPLSANASTIVVTIIASPASEVAGHAHAACPRRPC